MEEICCPECGGELLIDPACRLEEPVWMPASRKVERCERIAPAALCQRCDFCIEIAAL